MFDVDYSKAVKVVGNVIFMYLNSKILNSKYMH